LQCKPVIKVGLKGSRAIGKDKQAPGEKAKIRGKRGRKKASCHVKEGEGVIYSKQKLERGGGNRKQKKVAAPGLMGKIKIRKSKQKQERGNLWELKREYLRSQKNNLG